MELSIVDNRASKHVELHVDGKVAGFLAYERTGETLTFTEIDTDLDMAGQGLGLVLVRKALDAAHAQKLSVVPACPFMRDYIKRHPTYLDLVPPDQRQPLGLDVAEAA
jgi:predicted GNAT family acetyltransferase